MNLIAEIRAKIAQGLFEFSQHAVDQGITRGIAVTEVRQALEAGEVIEDYPNDKYGPSCLVFGMTPAGRPLHVQCSYPSRPIVKIITRTNLILICGSSSGTGGGDAPHERQKRRSPGAVPRHVFR